MWWGCGTMPEYLISYFEMHLHDQYGAGAEILRLGAHTGVFGAALALFFLLTYNDTVRSVLLILLAIYIF